MNRVHLGGIGLAVALLAFMVIPLMLRNANHPLSGNTTVDVCALLQGSALEALGETPVAVEARLPGEKVDGKPVCTAELAIARTGDPPRFASVWIATQRMMATEGRPVATDRVVETWLKESKASGSTVSPVKGKWRNAGLIGNPRDERKLTLLIDDAGVMINITGEGVPRDAMLAFGEAATRSLRGK